MDSQIKVAVFQMATGFDIQENARRIREAIGHARDDGADLLVTPECALSGYVPGAGLNFAALERAQAELVEAACEAGIHLALGTTRHEADEWFNTALLFSPSGELLGRYDKSHLIGADLDAFRPGADLPVFKVGQWTLALQVCFDMRFPENWRILRRKGAELVLHLSNASRSSSWKVPVLEGAIRSRAADNGMYVASANDARPPQMMVSAICDPNGCDLARAPENEETLLVAELDRTLVKTDFLDARRLDLWSRPENRDLLLS